MRDWTSLMHSLCTLRNIKDCEIEARDYREP